MITLHSIPIEQPAEKSPYLKAALAVHTVVEAITQFWYYPNQRTIHWMYMEHHESDSMPHWVGLYDARAESRNLDDHIAHITLEERERRIIER